MKKILLGAAILTCIATSVNAQKPDYYDDAVAQNAINSYNPGPVLKVTKINDVYDVKFGGHQLCKVPVTALKSELEIESAGLELEEIAPIPCGAKHDLLAYTYQHWFTKNVWADFKLVLKGQQDVLAHAEVKLIQASFEFQPHPVGEHN